MEVHHHHHRDRTSLANQSNDDRSSLRITNVIKDKYRQLPEITSEQMIEGYVPSPRIHLCDTLLTIPRQQREPRFCHSSKLLVRPDYCDLCLTDYHTDSAWIRYNEQRVEQLQRRINLMLQIDDDEEVQLLYPTPPIIPTTATVTQRIDDALSISSRHRSQLLHRSDQIGKAFFFFFFPSRLNKYVNMILMCFFSITSSISISITSIRSEFSACTQSTCHTFDHTGVEICSNIYTIGSTTNTFTTIDNIYSSTDCIDTSSTKCTASTTTTENKTRS